VIKTFFSIITAEDCDSGRKMMNPTDLYKWLLQRIDKDDAKLLLGN